MKNSLIILFLALTSAVGFIGIAQALPDMTSDEAVTWFGQNRSINALEPTQQLEPGMSDFDLTMQMEGGTVNLSVFLNDQGVVETENIDFRPGCYPSLSCSGTVRFEKADREGGQRLIETVWGQEILEDFQSSTLIETDSNLGTKRWYEGTLYNYETWHYTNYTIAHFTVVSKQVSQADRIQEYTYCSSNPRNCGP